MDDQISKTECQLILILKSDTENKFLTKETQLRIQKEVTGLIFSYTSETGPHTTEPTQNYKATDIKILSKLLNKTRRDRIQSQHIREECNAEHTAE